jgi:hypothetical protein
VLKKWEAGGNGKHLEKSRRPELANIAIETSFPTLEP